MTESPCRTHIGGPEKNRGMETEADGDLNGGKERRKNNEICTKNTYRNESYEIGTANEEVEF